MLEANFSGHALCDRLFQKKENENWISVAYYSRKLNGAKMNNEIHYNELAIIACMKE